MNGRRVYGEYAVITTHCSLLAQLRESRHSSIRNGNREICWSTTRTEDLQVM